MKTVEDLRASLAEAGIDPDNVGRAEDRSLPRIDGVLLVRPIPTGVRVITWERGQEYFPRDFPSEADAVRYLAPHLLNSPPKVRLSPEELAEKQRRTQERAQRTLASFEAAKQEDG